MSSPHRIDVHQHVVPPFYAQALARNLAGRRRWLQYWRPARAGRAPGYRE